MKGQLVSTYIHASIDLLPGLLMAPLGAKRWIFLPPEECQSLYINPLTHPEGAVCADVAFFLHTTSSPIRGRLEQTRFVQVSEARRGKVCTVMGYIAYLIPNRAAQVVLREGEVLYLPRSVTCCRPRRHSPHVASGSTTLCPSIRRRSATAARGSRCVGGMSWQSVASVIEGVV